MIRFFLTLFFAFFITICNVAHNLHNVRLDCYGSIQPDDIGNTIALALNDIEGKCLILPDTAVDLSNLIITSKKNFAIKGSKKFPITCKDVKLFNCSNFELSNLYIKGTKQKFVTFYIVGNCSDFNIHDCIFDSEKDADGHNTFYGIHIIADISNPNASFDNSPRNFRIYDNEVKNTRYDGILVHAYCSDFVIEENNITGVECIGIEVEGRYGGFSNTTVHPCRNVVIMNNTMNNCGDWNILLMWVDNVKAYGNKCYNGYGSFLSVGCTHLEVKNNILEGRYKGFELSNEFYKISNGINDGVLINGNTITGAARSLERGVIDIRHSKNVIFKKNHVTSLYKANTACISITSSQDIELSKNSFSANDKILSFTHLFNNTIDFEIKKSVPELDVKSVLIRNNTFTGYNGNIKDNGIKSFKLDRNRYNGK